MDYKLIVPVLISFALSLLMGPVVIPFLRKLKMGQTERVEGVQSHLKKAGTPTMGGVIILGSVLLTSGFLYKRISEDHTGAVCDTWFWIDRISR